MQIEHHESTLAVADPRADDRVRSHTAPYVNQRIDRLTEASIARCAAEGRDAIIARLKDLDREWDIDRALMANFAIVGAVTNELGRSRIRGRMLFQWFLRIQQGFLLLHATVGWCPPVVLFRRLGFRTQKEIQAERMALVRHLEQGGQQAQGVEDRPRA
jgi:hypothetical protein